MTKSTKTVEAVEEVTLGLGGLWSKVEDGKASDAEHAALAAMTADWSDEDWAAWYAADERDTAGGRGRARRGRTLDGKAVFAYDDVLLNRTYGAEDAELVGLEAADGDTDTMEETLGRDGAVLDTLTANTADQRKADAIVAAITDHEVNGKKRKGRPSKMHETLAVALTVGWTVNKKGEHHPDYEAMGARLDLHEDTCRDRWETVVTKCRKDPVFAALVAEAVAGV